MASPAQRLEIYCTSIPMRGFQHAAASRDAAEAVVVRLELTDGCVGWGETLPRPYVTGETIESVAHDLAETIWPACRAVGVEYPDATSAIPARAADGRCINAAACAMELAMLDAAGYRPSRTVRRIAARVSGVLGSSDPDRTARQFRRMRWFGLRDFKLKLGFEPDVDAANLRTVHARLGKAIARGKASLRVDVNGGWDAASAPQRVAELVRYGVCVVEQPVYCEAEELLELAESCRLPLMADESLLREVDARTLLACPRRVWWNVRISKNGGLGRAADLARLAAQNDVPFTVGCMVGESSLLSAAQRLLLARGPQPRFVEGNYGRFLLSDDLTARSLRIGFAGRLGMPAGLGLGVRVDPAKMLRYGTRLATLWS